MYPSFLGLSCEQLPPVPTHFVSGSFQALELTGVPLTGLLAAGPPAPPKAGGVCPSPDDFSGTAAGTAAAAATVCFSAAAEDMFDAVSMVKCGSKCILKLPSNRECRVCAPFPLPAGLTPFSSSALLQTGALTSTAK